MSTVLNMPGLQLWQRSEYVKVTQGAKICLNNDLREYALITLNMLEYAHIYLNKQSSEYA